MYVHFKNVAGAFERFWLAYPSRGKHANPKTPARQLFSSIVEERGIDPELLIAAATRFAEAVTGTEPRFVCQAVTWLRQERWNDQDATPHVAVAVKHSAQPEIGEDEWRQVLDAWREAGGSTRDWPRGYGLPPTHAATRVPKHLRQEYGYNR